MAYLGVKPAAITSATEAEIAGDLTVDTNTLVVDAANNRVGIATASPALPLEVSGSTNVAVFRSDASNSIIQLANSTGTGGDNGVCIGSVGDDLFLRAGDSERMRIDSSGEALIGTTSAGSSTRLHLKGGATLCVMQNDDANGGTFQTTIHFRNSSGNTVGTIKTNSSSTAYNTSSDYRLKQGVEDMTGAIDRVKALAPKRFQFIADPDTTVDGFLAHEAQAVVPEAITGTKDEVDDDDNPVMQGIDQSKLVPLLTGALREAIAKIETLETEITALKARVTALEDA